MPDGMGKKFRELVTKSPPLQVLGTINAYSAMLAEKTGAQAIYISGAGVANASYGLPDLGITSLPEVLEDVKRVTDVSNLPVLVDIDTGFGNFFGISRTINQMEKAGVAAVHIEDQVAAKRCGHRPNKSIVSMQEMGDRIKAAVDARNSKDFVIMARTDAYAKEGIERAIERTLYYVELGADMIFPEAITSLDEYEKFCKNVNVPVLANITEFGKTPLFTKEELKNAGVDLILYPLSAFRAMSLAALQVYSTILDKGSAKDVLEKMQTREDLYDVLGYKEYEKKLDAIMENQNGQ